MAQRTEPSRAFLTRDDHRGKLTAHFFGLCGALAIVFVTNRFVTPDTFWAPWVALPLGLAFVAHLVLFARGTLATMGARRDR